MSDAENSISFAGVTATDGQLRELIDEYPALAAVRLVVDVGDAATLLCVMGKADMTLAPALRSSMAVLGWPAGVVFVDASQIPSDGLLIEDRR